MFHSGACVNPTATTHIAALIVQCSSGWFVILKTHSVATCTICYFWGTKSWKLSTCHSNYIIAYNVSCIEVLLKLKLSTHALHFLYLRFHYLAIHKLGRYAQLPCVGTSECHFIASQSIELALEYLVVQYMPTQSMRMLGKWVPLSAIWRHHRTLNWLWTACLQNICIRSCNSQWIRKCSLCSSAAVTARSRKDKMKVLLGILSCLLVFLHSARTQTGGFFIY